MARQFCRWDPDLKIIGLRFSNVMEPADYARFPSFDADPGSRKCNLWGYIDARDAAQAVRKAVEAPLKGAEVFIIAMPTL
jgi:nucleoside-diphosphate-sugar epimerase